MMEVHQLLFHYYFEIKGHYDQSLIPNHLQLKYIVIYMKVLLEQKRTMKIVCHDINPIKIGGHIG